MGRKILRSLWGMISRNRPSEKLLNCQVNSFLPPSFPFPRLPSFLLPSPPLPSSPLLFLLFSPYPNPSPISSPFFTLFFSFLQ